MVELFCLELGSTTESREIETTKTMSKEDKVLDYIRQNGSISMQKTMKICMHKSRSGARKLIDKMINADLIERSGEKNNTFYKIKE